MTSDYRLAGPVIVRILGVVLVLGGLVVLAGALLAVALDLGAALAVGSAVVVVLVVLALAGWLRRASVVHLDEAGYRVRWVRGAGVRHGSWRDVEDVVATTVLGTRCVVLRRRDGRSTTVPVQILAAGPEEFVADLQEHLNRGHGYRPLR